MRFTAVAVMLAGALALALPAAPASGQTELLRDDLSDEHLACETDADCSMSDFAGCCQCCNCTVPYAINVTGHRLQQEACATDDCVSCEHVECEQCAIRERPANAVCLSGRCTAPAPFVTPVVSVEPASAWTDAERRTFCDAALEYMLADPRVAEVLCYANGARLGDECAEYVAACPERPEAYVSKCFILGGHETCSATAEELARCVTLEAERLRAGRRSCKHAADDVVAGPCSACQRVNEAQQCGFVPIAFD